MARTIFYPESDDSSGRHHVVGVLGDLVGDLEGLHDGVMLGYRACLRVQASNVLR